jgi:stress-induced-phosphoprotein 1
MCRGQEGSTIASFSSEDSGVKWQLEQRGALWRLAVEASARPNVDLSSTEVKLELSDAGKSVVLSMPSNALPIEIASASCKYSKKKGELVLEWPGSADMGAPSVAEMQAAPASEDSADKSSMVADEMGSNSTEAPSPEEAESADSSAAEETESVKSEDQVTEVSTPTPAQEKPSNEAQAEASTKAKAEEAQAEASTKAKAEEKASIEAQSEAKAQSKETEITDQLKAEDPVIQEVSAEEFKALGNEAIKKNELKVALEHYNNGLRIDPDHAMILSNRALCHHKLGLLELALEDAHRVIVLKPDFYKAYIRAAMVLRELEKPQEAVAILKKAPHNDEVGKLVAEIRPEAEAAEAARIASLGGAEKLKEEGNALFKKGLYEQALPKYTQIIEKHPNADPALILAVRNNRAACNHQISNFDAVVADSSWVLEREPDNLKALIRRMIALEPMEKYEKALADARHILRLCPGHEVANKVQHRLSRLVRQGY